MGARLPEPAVLAAASSAGAESGREYPFNDRDFERVRKLIRAMAGISLNETKQNMVYSRLSRRLRSLRIDSFSQYLDELENNADFGGQERQEFINALTTNLTSFYREAHHFEVLADFVRGRSQVRAWCAAASTGEEPYSIIFTLLETLGERANIKLLATDIDTNVLATARRGVYPADNARSCGDSRLKRFCLRGSGDNQGFVRIRPEVARLVEFAPLNLLAESWPTVRDFSAQLDVVFCRNVMIYFDRATQREILARFAQVIRPGGLLLVGHSENFTDTRAGFTLRGKTVYERTA